MANRDTEQKLPQSQLPKELPQSKNENVMFKRLRAIGMDENEIRISRMKLAQFVAEVDPTASLNPEVEEVLLELSSKFVESAAKFGCKLAQHRGSKYLEIDDVRHYVETMLGVHVPGFGSTVSGSLPASLYADSHERGGPGRPNEDHTARLKLRKRAHIVLEDNFAVAVQQPQWQNLAVKSSSAPGTSDGGEGVATAATDGIESALSPA